MTQVVAALVWKQDRFMICQRPVNKTRALEWEFVGGKVEKGETLEQALVRECREEIGVEPLVGSVYAEVDHVYPDITIHLTLFNASLKDEEPQKLEHNDIRFILPSEIPQFEFCPADKDILDKIIRDFGNAK